MNNMERKVRLRRELEALQAKMAKPQKLPALYADMRREREIWLALGRQYYARFFEEEVPYAAAA